MAHSAIARGGIWRRVADEKINIKITRRQNMKNWRKRRRRKSDTYTNISMALNRQSRRQMTSWHVLKASAGIGVAAYHGGAQMSISS